MSPAAPRGPRVPAPGAAPKADRPARGRPPSRPPVSPKGRTNLPAAAGAALLSRRMTVAVAESCTGGLLGSLLTDVPGSSRYFLGGVVAYQNRAKLALLGVPAAMLRRQGAVSAAVAAAMAGGVRRLLGSDLALAITGIAGPGGGAPGKPVGLVHVALSSARRTAVARGVFAGGRARVRRSAADLALNLLLDHLEDGR